MIFAARQLQEKCQEQHQDLYMTFVDLTRAFDTVSRSGLWKIMAKFGCPDKFIALVRSFHDGMQVRVQDDGELSEPIPVTNGVKQGCVLAPTLFSMMFSAMLTEAFKDGKDGVEIEYRMDGGLHNIQRFRAKSKTKEDCVRDLLFADDCALNASTEEKMQKSMDKFSDACTAFGLTISTKKTEVLYQPAPNKTHSDPTITVNGQPLKSVNNFTYLGSTLSRDVRIDDEVALRLSKASSAFGRLQTNVWNRKGLSIDTKLKVYQAVVLPSLLYASETWTTYSQHMKKLNCFHLRCLRNIMGIRWQDRVTNVDVLQRAKMPSVQTMIQTNQLRWSGHLVRMSDNRLPKRIFYSQLASGKRSHGGQLKRYKDNLKSALKSFDISTKSWEILAMNRAAWRSSVRKGAVQQEGTLRRLATEKRARRKCGAATPDSQHSTDFLCPGCGRQFSARIGLYSHRQKCAL